MSFLGVVLALSGGDIAGIVVGSVIGGLALIAASVGVFFGIRKHNFLKKIEGVKNAYNNACQTLAGLDSDLTRLSNLGKFSEQKANQYKTFFNEKKEIIDGVKASASEAVSGLAKQAENKNLFQTGNASEAFATVKRFGDRVNNLRMKIGDALAEDILYRGKLSDVTSTYRDFKDYWEKNKQTLQPVNPYLEYLDSGLNESFKSYSVCLEKADYEKAKILLVSLEKIVKVLDTYGMKLADFVTLSTSTLPEHLKNLYLEYVRIQREGIPLNHLGFEAGFKGMVEEIQDVRASFRTLNLGHDQELLDDVSTKIDNFSNAFREEKEAKNRFDEDKTDYAGWVYEVEEKIKDCSTLLGEKRKEYKISPDWERFASELDYKETMMVRLHNNYQDDLNSAVPSPYSVLVEESGKLRKYLDDFDSELMNFKSYLEQLTKTKEDAVKALSFLRSRVCIALANVRETYSPAFYQKEKAQAEKIFEDLSSLYKAISQSQIDIEEVKSAQEKAQEGTDDFVQGCDQQMKARALAETKLININRYIPQMNAGRDTDASSETFEKVVSLYHSADYQECSAACDPLIKSLIEAYVSPVNERDAD